MTDSTPARRIADVQPSSAALWTGLYTGALLVTVLLGSLVAANRLSWLENRALERNAASYSLFVIFMMIPVFRFLNRPLQMFTSAMIGWLIFIIAYDLSGFFFHNLFQVLRTPLEALFEGAVVYGVLAVSSWVGAMVLHVRSHPITSRRRRSNDPAPHHR